MKKPSYNEAIINNNFSFRVFSTKKEKVAITFKDIINEKNGELDSFTCEFEVVELFKAIERYKENGVFFLRNESALFDFRELKDSNLYVSITFDEIEYKFITHNKDFIAWVYTIKNKRTEKRVLIDLDCSYICAEMFGFGVLVDISENGCRLACGHKIDIGEIISISVLEYGLILNMKCKVTHVENGNDKNYLHGLKIIDMPDNERELLERYLSKLK